MHARRLAAALIVAICLGGPIVEMFDQWDQTLQDGNDTEANVIVAALCVGFAIAIGKTGAVAARMRTCGAISSRRNAATRSVMSDPRWFPIPGPTTSPPAPLRV